MKQQTQEIYEKIRSIIKIKGFNISSIKLKTFNMRTFLWMSSIYALVWIIISCNPYALYNLFAYGDPLYHIKELVIATLEFMLLVYFA